MKLTAKKLASMIDQTMLSPKVGEVEIIEFCKKAAQYGFASVCVNPVYVKTACKILHGSKTKVCTVIDFPLGAGGTKIKCKSAGLAIAQGAQEVDVVADIALIKSHDWNELTTRMEKFINSIPAEKNIITKVILETCFLTPDEITMSSKCAAKAGFCFVKTSTGFAINKDSKGKSLPNGATTEAVRLMRLAVGKKVGVKASGGIHTTEEALLLINSGATRIGSSSGCAIVDGIKE